jgi:diaminopimelate epimerase
MKVPFTKAHGARNDFLLTPRESVPEGADPALLAVAICDRHTGAGADGWIVISPASNADAAIELWNSDGSGSTLSGNGTRCVAVYLVENGLSGGSVRIATGAGVKHLRLLERRDHTFTFEMNMGRASIEELHHDFEGRDGTILDVGNPQCAVFVDDFDFDWRSLGARIENHPRFPQRTNVSFIRVEDPHSLDVRFWERGAGETMSSGTGSTGAAAAAMARGAIENSADSSIVVRTPAGPLSLRVENGEMFLAGPAQIVVRGDFYY